MKRKQVLCALAALLLAFALALPAFAAGQALIVDEVDKIYAGNLPGLNRRAQAISDQYQIDVGFLLTNDDYAPAKTLVEYTRERFPGISHGFVLGHDIKSGKSAMALFGDAEEFVSDAAIARMRTAYDDAETFSDGVRDYLGEAEKLLAKIFPDRSGPIPAAPQVVRDPSEVSLLMDEAHLLNDTEAAQLREKLMVLSDKWKNDFVIVTTDTIGDNTAEEYADDFFDYNHYGQATSGDITDGDGVLMLIYMDKTPPGGHISTKGQAIRVITDAGYQFIGKQVRAHGLDKGDYAAAFDCFVTWCDQFYEQAQEGKPYDSGHMPKVKKTSGEYGRAILMSFLYGLIIAFIVVRRMKKQLKTVHMKASAADYLRPGSLNVAYANEQFLYKNVTRVHNPPDSGGSSGGGSSSHSSSSGSSHGGGGF